MKIKLGENLGERGAEAEERFLKSYPFHPDLRRFFYSEWTQLPQFQKIRGVLRTFALALRDAEAWDSSSLVGPSVFLNDPKEEGLRDAFRELVTVADTGQTDGSQQA